MPLWRALSDLRPDLPRQPWAISSSAAQRPFNPAMSTNWEAFYDHATGRTFYYDSTSDSSTWVKPISLDYHTFWLEGRPLSVVFRFEPGWG